MHIAELHLSLLAHLKKQTKEKKCIDFSEGKGRMIDVMIKDSARYADMGGWGFEEFKENIKTERTVKDLAKQQYYSCHEANKGNDFVFSISGYE